MSSMEKMIMLNKVTGEGNTAIEANTLCQECGICCDGTLFSFVKIYPEEVKKTKNLGITVYKDKNAQNVFDLGCPRFVEGSCTVYLERPRKCCSFSCKLQRDVMNGTIKYEESLKIVALVKKHTSWIRDAIISKAKPNHKKMNHRLMLYDYLMIAVDKNKRGELTGRDEERIKRIFEQIKLTDRFFEETSLLKKYADLIQNLKRQPD